MSSPAESLPDETARAIRKAVDEAIEKRLADYRKQMKAFVAGVCVFLALLLGDRFLGSSQFINFLREQAVAFGPQLSRFLGKTVAFSYTNEYWIQDPVSEQQLAFFAKKPQDVQALIQVAHQGTGERLDVSYSLDFQPPIQTTPDDIPWTTINLGAKLWDPQMPAPAAPANVHYLVFRVNRHGVKTDDRVFVRVLVNVIGLEDHDQ